ncbi:unnamed protein product [Acanthoscelides obtectus]|uniref:Uncharacterized protein n=1 Tax=Acanthoscelides obtectus TaxID=200917 RepID=A0A9P0K2C4_ACAOB|nr:unnamed protein product [Acanthoscelides obtectus]CAK1629042.1 hypothetical protein AOBTE_LOCUS5549 [Acanthoscelides obtectus]
MFPTLTNFVFNMFSLPNVKKIFSQINLNKTEIKNKLSTENLSGVLHTFY